MEISRDPQGIVKYDVIRDRGIDDRGKPADNPDQGAQGKSRRYKLPALDGVSP